MQISHLPEKGPTKGRPCVWPYHLKGIHLLSKQFKELILTLSRSNEVRRGVGKDHVSAHGADGGCGAGVPRRRGIHLHACLCPAEEVLRVLWRRVSGVPADT